MMITPLLDNRKSKLKIQIAIIDDDLIIQTTLNDIVRETLPKNIYDYDICTYKDGVQFFTAIKSQPLDISYLVILDIIMPKMNGFEVLQKIRKLPNQERFSVMLLSSINSKKDIAKAVQLEADDFLTKPIQLVNFKVRLTSLIKRMIYR